MPVQEAWETLGIDPSVTRAELKKAFREKIREVHPDVTGDDGTMLQKVRDAFAIVDGLENPVEWHVEGMEAGLPAWASGLLQGVQWSEACPSFVAFMEKENSKALAVGEYSAKTGIRPWAAAWGKFSQQEANAEALRLCRQYTDKCKLIYVGSGNTRQRKAVDPTSGPKEREWWKDMFKGGGNSPGFGWIPMIDPAKEKVVGYKTIDVGVDSARVRIPVFKALVGGPPYYYTPLRPKEKTYLKRPNFQHHRPLTGARLRRDPRMKEAMAKVSQTNLW